MSLTEIEHLRTLDQIGGYNYWRGMRSFLVDESAVRSESLGLWHKTFPGMSGPTAPICTQTRAQFHPGGVEDVAMIQAHYETPRRPGKAMLLTESRTVLQKVLKEPGADGKIIEGPDPDNPWAHWVVVKGDNRIERYQNTALRLETAYYASEFSLADALELEGTVNSSSITLVGFGSVAKEKLKCLPPVTSQQYGDDLIYVNYLFQWSGPDVTWNEQIESQQGVWVVEKVPILELQADGTYEQDGTNEAVVFKPGMKAVKVGDAWTLEVAAKEARKLYPLKSFSILQGLTSW